MEQFDSNLSSAIDSTLGMRCRLYGYQYSEIIRSLMSVYFCGGSCIEDVTTHLMCHLSLYPTLRTCSVDTILRAIKELTQDNISYTSDTGKTYDFNTAGMLNTLLPNCLLSTGQLKEGEGYDVDFDHFYKFIMARLDVKRFGLKATSRIKAFVFKFISVPAKWVRTSRQYGLNIYSCNNAYADVFQNDFG